MSMKIEVSLYGTLAQYLPEGTQGRTALINCSDGVTVGEVIDQLGIPKPCPTMILVNGIYTDPNTPLREGDLLALFPPLVGGATLA